MQIEVSDILQEIEANAHLVKEEGSVGGNPKALMWNTESSYHPGKQTDHVIIEMHDPGMERAEQQKMRLTFSQNEAGLGVKTAVKLVWRALRNKRRTFSKIAAQVCGDKHRKDIAFEMFSCTAPLGSSR